MSLTVADWVQVIAFGALLGAAGQIVRVVAGLKKLNEEASRKNVEAAKLFSTSQFVFSILIGAVAGLLGALSLGVNPKELITTDKVISLLGVGYAGADFIEAFMTKRGVMGGAGSGAGAAGEPTGSTPAPAAISQANVMKAAGSATDQSSPTQPKTEEAVG